MLPSYLFLNDLLLEDNHVVGMGWDEESICTEWWASMESQRLIGKGLNYKENTLSYYIALLMTLICDKILADPNPHP